MYRRALGAQTRPARSIAAVSDSWSLEEKGVDGGSVRAASEGPRATQRSGEAGARKRRGRDRASDEIDDSADLRGVGDRQTYSV